MKHEDLQEELDNTNDSSNECIAKKIETLDREDENEPRNEKYLIILWRWVLNQRHKMDLVHDNVQGGSASSFSRMTEESTSAVQESAEPHAQQILAKIEGTRR